MISPRALCQIEFKSTDIQRSLAFFEEVFGWRVLPITLQDYFVMEVPDDTPFGISLSPCSEPSSTETQTLVYFRCEAPIEGVINQIVACGAQVLEGPRSVPAYGKALKLREPGGIALGLFFPNTEPYLHKVE